MGIISRVDVANMALDHLKEYAITSLDIDVNSTPTAQICARWEDQSRRTALRRHTWNFAMKQALLPRLVETPLHTYDSMYSLPADFVRMAHIGEDACTRPRYQIQDSKIMLDSYQVSVNSAGALPITYVRDFTEVSKMDALFILTWSLEWAIEMCGKITGTTVNKQELVAELRRVAPEAYTIDGQDSPPIRVSRSRAKASRRGFGMSRGNTRVGWD